MSELYLNIVETYGRALLIRSLVKTLPKCSVRRKKILPQKETGTPLNGVGMDYTGYPSFTVIR